MSSSSSPYSVFNPDLDLRKLISLEIEHADGTVEVVLPGAVKLQAGANVLLDQAAGDDQVLLSAQAGKGIENPYYRQKYNALTGNGLSAGPYAEPDGAVPVGTPWSFTDPYWFGSLNGVQAEPVTGSIFLLVDRCSAVGEFETTAGHPEAGAGTLGLLDICLPCVDCLAWQRFDQYLLRLEAFYDYIFALSYNTNPATPPTHPDGGTPIIISGLLQQTAAALRYWDYLVHRSTTKLAAQAQGQAITASGFYRNISSAAVGTSGGGVSFTFWFTFLYRAIGSPTYCYWRGVSASLVTPRVLMRSGANNCLLYSINYITSAITPCADDGLVLAHTVKVVMNSNWDGDGKGHIGLNPGEEAFADLALVITNLIPFDNVAHEYMVQVVLDIGPTHIGNPAPAMAEQVFFMPNNPAST